LSLKGNQGNLVEQVEDSFRFLPVNAFDDESDCGHGRVETRRCSVISDLSLIESREEWTGLKTLIIFHFFLVMYENIYLRIADKYR
jgi:hypothetical protein